MPTWKIKEKTVDEKGLATTKTITTENISLMQKLLNMNEKKDTKNPQQEPKASKKKEATKIKQISLKAPEIKMPKQEVKKQLPKLKKVTPRKLEPPKKKEVKALPAPATNTKPGKKKIVISRKAVEGKARIEHHTRNLNSSQIQASNYNSFDGNRGDHSKRSYEYYRNKIEFSGLSNEQKSKLLDKLYKLYEPIIRYDSQWYSPMVSGPARYPQAKMDAILERMMEANSKFVDWWKSIEPKLEASKYVTKEDKKKQESKAKKEKIKDIKEGFDLWYNRLLNEIPEYKKRGEEDRLRYSVNADMAMSYVSKALKVDTNLYKELFDKVNKVCKYSKNSNYYKAYKLVQEGKISSNSIQKQEAEDNKVIYSCSDYEVSNLKIDAGKRISIKFLFYPKPQLVYALKKRGYTWYSYKECFICKPERFDLEWAKSLSEQYKKYI